MKRVGFIVLLVLLNLAFVYEAVHLVMLSYGLVVAPMGPAGGKVAAGEISRSVLLYSLLAALAVAGINYLFLKKLIRAKRPVLVSVVITVLAILIFLPCFVSVRQSFIEYQDNGGKVKEYIRKGKESGEIPA